MGWRRQKVKYGGYKHPKHLTGKNYHKSIYYKSKYKKMKLHEVVTQKTEPTFWDSSIRPYPIFFVAVFLVAPIIYFGPNGIKEITLLNKGTGWPLVFSIIIWGFITLGIIWFWLNHKKIVRIWKSNQKLKG